MTQAVLLFGHADSDESSPSLNQLLAQRYTEGYIAAGGTVRRFDIATLQFDPVMRRGYRASQPLEPDLERVKEAIEQAQHVTWVFPTYWASPPAIVRGLFDRLFLPRWAFSYEKDQPLPKGLLKGRSSRVVMTMDSPWFWYTFVNQRCIHRSFGGASLKFCGFSPVQFTTVHGVRSLSPAARATWQERVYKLGIEDATRPSPRPASRLAPAPSARLDAPRS
ncbi:MAG TPA: NAD(P)H-dependent oxidoreductase [Polyangiaceae bacterium]|nr:NAD(P)H-dependent oxidoreductase [Polyangiaceae bacterium]